MSKLDKSVRVIQGQLKRHMNVQQMNLRNLRRTKPYTKKAPRLVRDVTLDTLLSSVGASHKPPSQGAPSSSSSSSATPQSSSQNGGGNQNGKAPRKRSADVDERVKQELMAEEEDLESRNDDDDQLSDVDDDDDFGDSRSSDWSALDAD